MNGFCLNYHILSLLSLFAGSQHGEGDAGEHPAQVQAEGQQGARGEEQDALRKPGTPAALQGPRHHSGKEQYVFVYRFFPFKS